MPTSATLPPQPAPAAKPPLAGVGGLNTLSRLQRHLVAAALLVLVAVGVVTWVFVDHSQRQLIEFKALTLAEVVARQAASARSVYTEQVAGKLKRDGAGQASEHFAHEAGNVPLPAQFLKLMGQRASADSGGLYSYRPVSKWNLGEGQHLDDDFQRWAWARLEAQDAPRPAAAREWQSAWRVEDLGGQRTLRMMRADPAASVSCVSCHNQLELRPQVLALRASQGLAGGKQWQQHQLLGALEVRVPLAPVEALAAQQRREVLAAVMALAASGVLLLGLMVFAGTRRATELTTQLAWQASHDSLTGLVNRPQFEQRLQHLLATAACDRSRHGLMFLDLDQFKAINDTCGHSAGDALLRELSQRLQTCLRAADTLARLGGDEFGVLLPGCGVEQALGVAHKLLQATADFRFDWHGRVFEVGVSIGLVGVDGQGQSVAQLMSAADMACYAAKDEGRHRVRVFDSSDAELSRRRDLLGMGERITTALAAGRVALAVQTARALDPSRPMQAYQELLLRMHDADGRPMPTGPLIEAAERLNMMSTRIDRWVLETACGHIRSGRLRADERHLVAVNLSAQSLCDEAFLAFAQDTLRDSEIDPRRLCFEITETAAIANLRRATHFMQAMRALGCLFALDDFGAGLSSFSYLKSLPVDYLKLDGAFVRGVATDPADRAMVAAMAGMGRALGLPTIAEFVENDEIRDELQALGIDYVQGYGIERPRNL